MNKNLCNQPLKNAAPDSLRPIDNSAVHSLDHFAMDVPDLDEAMNFYRAFGLDARVDGDSVGLYAPNNSQRWAVLRKAVRKRLTGLCFRVYPSEIAALRERLMARGFTLQRHDGESFSVHDPDGLEIEICAGGRVTVDEKAPFVIHSAPAGKQAVWPCAAVPLFSPQRLSHIAIFCSDVDRAIEFYCGVLGLAVSDRSSSMLAFLHSVHGSDHHILALAKSTGPGMHHCSWDMGSIDAIELSAARIAEAGYRAGWGLGRHVLGSNYFHYIRDPWGSYCEYTADIDYIPAGCGWRGGDHAPQDAMYLWGPNPPADFIVNHEVEAAVQG
ncbi:MAG: metapyrocatechase [Verrucomicrobiaceae bacterium]|nr:metapyrocatechase [Verrucomicrobiaceae bacterium]